MGLKQTDTGHRETKISDVDWLDETAAEKHRHLLREVDLTRRWRGVNCRKHDAPIPKFLAASVSEQKWRAKAKCLGAKTEMFFPSSGHAVGGNSLMARAKRVCADCPVREECLLDALETDDRRDPFGIRGGKPGPERKLILKYWWEESHQSAVVAA